MKIPIKEILIFNQIVFAGILQNLNMGFGLKKKQTQFNTMKANILSSLCQIKSNTNNQWCVTIKSFQNLEKWQIYTLSSLFAFTLICLPGKMMVTFDKRPSLLWGICSSIFQSTSCLENNRHDRASYWEHLNNLIPPTFNFTLLLRSRDLKTFLNENISRNSAPLIPFLIRTLQSQKGQGVVVPYLGDLRRPNNYQNRNSKDI